MFVSEAVMTKLVAKDKNRYRVIGEVDRATGESKKRFQAGPGSKGDAKDKVEA